MNELEIKYPIGTDIVHNGHVMHIHGVGITSFGNFYHLIDKLSMKSYTIPTASLGEDNCQLIGKEKVDPQVIVYKFKPRDQVVVKHHKHPFASWVVDLSVFEGLDYKYSIEREPVFYTELELEFNTTSD